MIYSYLDFGLKPADFGCLTNTSVSKHASTSESL